MIRGKIRVVGFFAGIFTVLFMTCPAYGRYQAEQTNKSSGFEQPVYREGEVIAKFKKDVATMTAKNTASSYAIKPVREFKILSRRKGQPYLLLKSDKLTTREMMSILENDPSVESVSPNYLRKVADTNPNDFLFGQLWGLHNTGQPVNGASGKSGADIDAPAAWTISTGAESVVVADIDTGVDYTHQDLAANMWVNPAPGTFDDEGKGYVITGDIYGINAVTGTGDPLDDDGHGTHTSGTIAAVGNNAAGITGVNWTARIMACKFLDASGFGSDADAITCIEYAVDRKINHGVNVVAINASWGGAGGVNNNTDPLYEAIEVAGNAGIIFVAAAGNSASDNDVTPFYPASYSLPNIISVAATDQNDNLASFSNYGAKFVDLGAPGTNILSTLPGGGYSPPSVGDLFFNNMESGTDSSNWTAGGTNNSWAITTEKSNSPTHAWSDSPGPPSNKNYLNNTDSSLEVKDNIDLSGTAGQDIRLGFWASVALEDGYDFLIIELSKDGGTTWNAVSSLTGQNPAWNVYAYYIPSEYRTAQFRFRFRLSTDGSITYDGVYLDDIGIGTGSGSDNYDYYNGTSMAAPHVTGAVALLSARYPTESLTDRVNRILAGVDHLSVLSGKTVTGGRLNLFNAISPLLPPRLITASAGSGGVIIPSGQIYVPSGTDKTFTITPDSGYYLAALLVDGSGVDTQNGRLTGYTFTSVTTDHTLAASFTVIITHTIIASSGPNGTITPSGDVVVSDGNNQTFTLAPDTGYHLATLLVDGSGVDTQNGQLSGYTFASVTGDHAIAATFEAAARVPSGGGGGGGGGAVGPLFVGVSALLGWWKRRKRR